MLKWLNVLVKASYMKKMQFNALHFTEFHFFFFQIVVSVKVNKQQCSLLGTHPPARPMFLYRMNAHAFKACDLFRLFCSFFLYLERG